MAAAAAGAQELWLGGGEPALRPDLPALIEALRGPTLGIETDGLALAAPGVAARLRDVGLTAARIALHSARSDAHDWLARQPGAARQVARAIRLARAAGLAVDGEVVVTRPTAPHLAETVAVLARLGARSVAVRRLRLRGGAARDPVALTPRLGLLADPLTQAARAADDAGIARTLEDWPLCVAPGLRARSKARPPLCWPDGAVDTAPLAGPCVGCPGAPRCAGAPEDYVRLFGWTELGLETPVSPARIGIRWAASALGEPPERDEPTRDVRVRVVRAAATGARAVAIGPPSLAHPAAPELIRECARLGFDEVTVAGEGSPIARWTPAALRGVRGVAAVELALFGPDRARHDARAGFTGAWDAAFAGIAALSDHAAVPARAYAVLSHPDEWPAYAAAWDAGALPGPPALRLSPSGGSLARLADVNAALPPGPARAAARALLPLCLNGIPLKNPPPPVFTDAPGFVPATDATGPVGRLTPCPAAVRCPLGAACAGLPEGWTLGEKAPALVGETVGLG